MKILKATKTTTIFNTNQILWPSGRKTKFILNLSSFKRNLSRGLPLLTDTPVKFYGNALEHRRQIMEENRDKSFVYR